jgi:hypothetical protein
VHFVKIGQVYANVDLVRDERDGATVVEVSGPDAERVRKYLEAFTRPWRPVVVWPDDDEKTSEAGPLGK